MTRSARALHIVALTALWLAGPAVAQDIYEPDNTRGTAREVVNTGTATNLTPETHSIAPAGDHDWYAIFVEGCYDITIETSGPVGDTVMDLYFGTGVVPLASDDDGGTGSFSLIQFTPPILGTYYVDIRASSASDIIDPYDITITTVACPTTTSTTTTTIVVPTMGSRGTAALALLLSLGGLFLLARRVGPS